MFSSTNHELSQQPNLKDFLNGVDKNQYKLACVISYHGWFSIEIPIEKINDDSLPIFNGSIGLNFFYLSTFGNENFCLCPGVMRYLFDCFYLSFAEQPAAVEMGRSAVSSNLFFENHSSILGLNIEDPRCKDDIDKITKLLKIDSRLSSADKVHDVGFFNIDDKNLPSEPWAIINNKKYNLVQLFEFICEKLPELYYIGISYDHWRKYLKKLENHENIDPRLDSEYQTYLEKVKAKQSILEMVIENNTDPEKLAVKLVRREEIIKQKNLENEMFGQMVECVNEWWLNRSELHLQVIKRQLSWSERISESDLKKIFKDRLTDMIDGCIDGFVRARDKKLPNNKYESLTLTAKSIQENIGGVQVFFEKEFNPEMTIFMNGRIVLKMNNKEQEIYNINNQNSKKLGVGLKRKDI